MAFQSLYRRYRPRTFAEVLGQDHATTALRNAVRDERVGHAYLFCGPRGTGKTSTARLLAKVLNCAEPVDGEPCSECEACVSVETGKIVDWLQELDAASNRGIDAMRDLLERVPFGTSGNRKVIVLDEVHMLTPAASNALLKTLEEPPEHVVFVLATTEPHNVLDTIQSRTQRYDFKLLGADVLSDHVRHLIDDAELELGEDAVNEAVRRGGGSARDTLSALDQIAAAGRVITTAAPVDDLLDGLAASDVGAVLAAVAESVGEGLDPRTIAGALVDRLRDAFLAAMRAPMRSTTDSDREQAATLADRMSPARLTSALEAIGTASVDMRQAPDPRLPLEVALVRLCRVGDDSIAGLVARIEALEQTVASGAAAAPQRTAATEPATVAQDTGTDSPATKSPATKSTAVPATPPVSPEGVGQPPASPAGRGGKAQAAREVLAQRGVPDDSPATPATADDGRPPLGRRDRPAQPQPDDTSHTEPALVESASAEAAPTEAPRAQTPPAGGASEAPSRDQVAKAWADEILPNLPRSALFRVGRFVEGPDQATGTYGFALPNQPHRDNCEKRREELEAALSAHFGTSIRLRMVVDGDVSPPGGSDEPDPGADEASDPDDEFIDPDSLVDAGDAPSTVDRLTQAFPGAEVIDGGSTEAGG